MEDIKSHSYAQWRKKLNLWWRQTGDACDLTAQLTVTLLSPVACDLTAQLTVMLLSPEGRRVEEALLELQKW